MDQRSGDGSNQWTIWSHGSQSESVDSRIFEMLDAKNASSLKKDHPELQLQEKNQSGRAKGSIG